MLLLRYDLHWKAGVVDYLRHARFLGDQLQPGVGFLWRELNGEYLYGSERHGAFPESWRDILRVPDTAQAFSAGEYADCFLRLVKVRPNPHPNPHPDPNPNPDPDANPNLTLNLTLTLFL